MIQTSTDYSSGHGEGVHAPRLSLKRVHRWLWLLGASFYDAYRFSNYDWILYPRQYTEPAEADEEYRQRILQRRRIDCLAGKSRAVFAGPVPIRKSRLAPFAFDGKS